MWRRIVSSLAPKHQPWSTRQSYTHELVHAMTFPFAVSLIEGGVIAVLALRAFDVSRPVYAMIMAAPMFSNLTSFVWARLARGRAKVRFIVGLQVMLMCVIGSIAFLPRTYWGGIGLMGLTVAARCLLAGSVTIRSTIWRNNYPRAMRATVTGRLVIVTSTIMAVVPLAGYALLDYNTDFFRLIYPASLLVASIGVMSLSRVRLRRGRELMAYERREAVRPRPHGGAGAIYEYDPDEKRDNFWSVLKRDRMFRSHMVCQFFQGMGGMGAEVAVIYLIAESSLGFGRTIALTTAVPMLLAMMTLPLWARLLDRLHITDFRVRHCGAMIAVTTLYWVGGWTGAMWLIVLGRVGQGLIRGGSMLAWNLGHNDFADRHMVSLYMGIHVTLTGVRGAFVPFVAMALLTGWDAQKVWFLPGGVQGFSGIGAHVFLVLIGSMVIAQVGYVMLSRRLRRAGQTPPAPGSSQTPQVR